MSQFDGLLDFKTEKKTTQKPKVKTASKTVASPPPARQPLPDKRTAKSKHSDYVQTSIYIKKQTQTAVKKALLDDTNNKDFSDLVEELLSGWVKKK